MPDERHLEVELKFEAGDARVEDFLAWAISLKPERYLHVISPDVYYEQGGCVVRHRHAGDAGELTTKRRTRDDDIRVRDEVDLPLDKKRVTLVDVQKFMGLAGWKRAMTLIKDCHIFWVKRPKGEVTLVLYDAWKLQGGRQVRHRRLVEVEVEKGSGLSPEEAAAELSRWRELLVGRFGIKDVVKESLYEIYSGKRYPRRGR